MDSKKSRLTPYAAVFLTLTAIGLLVAMVRWSERSLGRPDFLTGYTLLGVSACMMLLSMRKRLLLFPLGRLAIWQQAHHYLGLFAIASFILHAGMDVHGLLETGLAFLFWSISLSGVVGWYINYSTPKMLRAAGAPVLRDDITQRRIQLAEHAYGIALQAAGKNESATLAEHYLQHLRPFFLKRRSFAYCLIPNGRMRRGLLHDLDQIVRYLGPEGRSSQKQLQLLVKQKDDLDFQWAMQNRLRGWVIVHVSLIWSYYLVVAYHVVSVHQFHGN